MAHILTVDDEEGFAVGISEFMGLEGHAAEAASTLAEARDVVAKRMPDVVLLDLMLPDGSGLELLDAFEDRRPQRIVIITGHSGVKAMIGGMAGDTISYMREPIEPRELLGMLNTLEFTGANRRHAGFFEQADSGTLFLDEITEMPFEMQTHLLRVLETGRVQRLGSESELPVNARLVVATNKDPGQAVRDDELREDLYFRLRVFPIEAPPLRERDDDLLLLASKFVNELNETNGTSRRLSEEAEKQIRDHGWPGNVRELKHTIHRAYLMANGDDIRMPARFDEDLPGNIEGLRAGRKIADVEKDLILATLGHLNGDKKAAAASLGISTRTLYNRLKEYDVPGD